MNKIFFVWISFATLMALITAVINFKTIEEKVEEHWFMWVSLPVWFTACLMVAGWRKIFYKEPMVRFFKMVYDSLFANKGT
jgi:membrane protein required for beta-lactamase induction